MKIPLGQLYKRISPRLYASECKGLADDASGMNIFQERMAGAQFDPGFYAQRGSFTKKHGFNALVDMSFYRMLAISLFYIIFRMTVVAVVVLSILARPHLVVCQPRLPTELSTACIPPSGIIRQNHFQRLFKGLQ